tara:strand:+ start:7921 stop:8178 length:258 start_codon:yes stop_codon:yes gene_type:complete
MAEDNIQKLDDSVVSHVAKLLQVALLTGTDIVDHMRMIRLKTHTQDNAVLVLEDEYRSIFDNSLETMVKNAEQSTQEESESSEQS